MEQTVVALYANRLPPAIELIHINERIHAKRLLIENQFVNKLPISPAILTGQLEHYNQRISERISQYEKIKLTTSESRWLNEFRKQYKQS